MFINLLWSAYFAGFILTSINLTRQALAAMKSKPVANEHSEIRAIMADIERFIGTKATCLVLALVILVLSLCWFVAAIQWVIKR